MIQVPFHYRLIGRLAVQCSDLPTWVIWMMQADRRLASDTIGSYQISTIFLGLDHNWGGGEPHLFETMIFNDVGSIYCNRCATWDEAEQQHRRAIDWARTQTASCVDQMIKREDFNSF